MSSLRIAAACVILGAAVAACSDYVDEPEGPKFCVYPTAWTAPSNGGRSHAVKIMNCGNGEHFDWKAEEDCPWIALSSSGGFVPDSLEIRAERNETGATRRDTITVRAMTNMKGSPRLVIVTQGSAILEGASR